jgi:hypothetical protein
LVLLFANATPVQAGGGGLRVFVYVHGSVNDVGKIADITVTTEEDYAIFQRVTIPQAEFYVEATFGKGEVDAGDHITACVYIESMNKEECGFAYNSEAPEPERIDVHMG